MRTFKLRGKRILLDKPEKKQSAIELTPEAEAELEQQYMKNWTKLTVFAVGTDVAEVKAEDKVYIPTHILQGVEVVQFSDGSIKLLVSENDVAIIW